MYRNYNNSRYYNDDSRNLDYYSDEEDEEEEMYPIHYQRPYYRRMNPDPYFRNQRGNIYVARGRGIPQAEYGFGYSHRRGPKLNYEVEEPFYSGRPEDLWCAQNPHYDGLLTVSSSKNKRRISMCSTPLHGEADTSKFGDAAAEKFEAVLSSGPCCSCTKLTMLSCVKCKSWYCSEECQRKNWKQHRDICVEMRPLRCEEGNPFKASHKEENDTAKETTISDQTLGTKKKTEHDRSTEVLKMKNLHIVKGRNDPKISENVVDYSKKDNILSSEIERNDFDGSDEAQVNDHKRKDRVGQNKVQGMQQGRRYQKGDGRPNSNLQQEKTNEYGRMEAESNGKSPQDGKKGNFMHNVGKRGSDGVQSSSKTGENKEKRESFRNLGMLMGQGDRKVSENECWDNEQEEKVEIKQGCGNQGEGASKGYKSGRNLRGQNRSESDRGTNQGQRFVSQKCYGPNQNEGEGWNNSIGQGLSGNNRGGGNQGQTFGQHFGRVNGGPNYDRGGIGLNSSRSDSGQNYGKGDSGQNYNKNGARQNYGKGVGGQNYVRGDDGQNFGKGCGGQNYSRVGSGQSSGKVAGAQNYDRGGVGQNFGKGGSGQNYGRGDSVQKFHGQSHNGNDGGSKFVGGQRLDGQDRRGDKLNYVKDDVRYKFGGQNYGVGDGLLGEFGQPFGSIFGVGGQQFRQNVGEVAPLFGQKFGEGGQQYGQKLGEIGPLFGQKLGEVGPLFGQKFGEGGRQIGHKFGGVVAGQNFGEGNQGNRGQQDGYNRGGQRGRGSRRDGNSNQKHGSGASVRNQGTSSARSAQISIPQEDWETENIDSPVSNSLTANISQQSTIGGSSAHLSTVRLPSGKFSQAIITVVTSPGHFWVQLSENVEDLKNILRIMNYDNDSKGKLISPTVGDLCSALYEDFVYRAKVLSIENGKAKVHYVDFGNSDICEFANMKEIPPSAMKYKAQALEIILAEGTSEKYMTLQENGKLAVKPIKKSKDGAVIVHVEGENYDRNITTQITELPINQSRIENIGGALNVRAEGGICGKINSVTTTETIPNEPIMDVALKKYKRTQWPKTILSYVKAGDRVLGEVNEIKNSDGRELTAILTFIPDLSAADLVNIFKEFPKDCSTWVKDPNFMPSKGDLLAALDDNIWKRAIVIGKESNLWEVALCDYGIVTKVGEIRQFPKNYKCFGLPALAVKCTFVQMFISLDENFSRNKFKKGSVIHLKVIAHNGVDIEADLETDSQERLGRVNVSMWKPEENAAQSVMIKSGCQVNILSVGSLKSLYVQPADVADKKKIERLLLDVLQACKENEQKPLKEPPSVGTIVGCKFSVDEIYYRAVITDVKSSKEISVTYIDFGNKESVPLERICELPRELSKAPPCCIEIGLKISNTSSINEEITLFLNKLILENYKLKLIYEDDLRNSVLMTENGMNINEKIDKLLIPTKWEKPTIKKSIFSDKIFMSSIKEEKLLADDENSKEVKLCILSINEKCHIACCSSESQHIREVYDKLSVDIANYCEKCPEQSYKPLTEEMCVAKFSDGHWYRASVMETKNNSYFMFFVDFGNCLDVKAEDIRKMKPEFMKVPVLATHCHYYGFQEDTITAEQEQRLKELIKENSVMKARIWRNEEDEDLVIDIPEITEILISEKLMP